MHSSNNERLTERAKARGEQAREKGEFEEVLRKMLLGESGQSMAEYALIAALVAVGAIVVLGQIGTNIQGKFTQIKDALQ